jgi:hypothetical protein
MMGWVMTKVRRGRAVLFMVALALVGLTATRAAAVPAYAVQTGQPCSGCHVGGFGPQLTPFGRAFKMGGYTLRADSFNLPVSAMVVASYLNTQKAQPSAPAPSFGANDNLALDQASLFIAGGLGSHLGAFVQTTYDGVAKAWHWDNLDVRAVTTATIKGVDMILGISVNNAPTLTDPFNTLAAWGFPYTGSSLAPAPIASPLIGSLAQDTLGVTAYAWINSEVYIEAGGYRSPDARTLTRLGVDPTDPGDIRAVSPYGRLAYVKDFGDRNVEVGAFAMSANIYPGLDESSGATDHYGDLGLDASYQSFAKTKDVITVNSRLTYESQRLDASQALGLSSNRHDHLIDARVDASYYFRDKIGATVGAFDTTGSSDALLYAADRTLRPATSGLNFQLDDTLYGGGGSPFGPRFNLRLGLQYTAYLQFDGASRNFDSLGHDASDNNTFRVFAWAAY